MKKWLNALKKEGSSDYIMTENDIYEGNHKMIFSEKTLVDHIWEFIKRLPQEIIPFLILIGTLSGFVIMLTEALNYRAAIGEIALPVITLAFLAVFYKAYTKYINYTPEALQGESDAVKIIFRKQKCGWQFALAWQMLSDRISNINLTLDRVDKGAEFIEPVYLAPEEYEYWLKLRPIALKRLVRAAMIQCTDEMPSFLGAIKIIPRAVKNEKLLTEFKNRVLALAQLYEHTKNYEIECHQIIPDDPLSEAVHEMTYGWTHPIQEGINEFMDILFTLSNIDRKLLKLGKAQVPDFNIIMRAPDNVDEFNRRFDEMFSQN